MLSTLSEEWLKIKIVRDFNKINKPQSNGIGMMNIHQKNKIFNFSPKYINLLELIKNSWFQIKPFRLEKLSVSDLNSMDIKFLDDVSKLDNIEITNSPVFTYIYVENDNIFSKFCTVSDFGGDTLQHIKDNRNNYIFHIYQINQNGAKWYKREDKNRLKKNRKEKLETLQKIEIEL